VIAKRRLTIVATVAMKVNSGMAITTNRVKGQGTEPKYLGWGTGTTPPVATNTGLQTPAAEARTNGTSSITTTNAANDTYKVDGLIICAGAGKTITEVATFDAAAAGNMDVRVTFDGIPLAVGDGINFTISTVYDQ
jgi:hypothetical protein